MIIYQENQISWVRNFEPLNPVSISRWPTRGGIYETLFIEDIDSPQARFAKGKNEPDGTSIIRRRIEQLKKQQVAN